MITVHHLEDSRSQRILWLLEELGVDYEIEFYARDPKTSLAPQSLKQVHPLGRSPVITDGEVTVAESGAIIEYLIETYYKSGQWQPGTPQGKREDRYWLHFGEGSLMPYLLLRLVFQRLSAPPTPVLVRAMGAVIGKGVISNFVQPRLKQQFEFIESTLNGRDWFADGDGPTAADFQMSFPLEASHARGIIAADHYPHTVDLVERIHARPAYQRALERGGDYGYA